MLRGTSSELEAEGSTRQFERPLPGRHTLDNLLAAIATARAIGISWAGIERGVHDVKPAYHRGIVVPFRGAQLYDAPYNSNPYPLGRRPTPLSDADLPARPTPR